VRKSVGKRLRHQCQYLDQPKDEYAPLEDSTLHRDFAALSATLGAVCAFARSHGSLTWGDPIILVDADGTPLDPVKASETLGTRSDRPWPLVHAEPVSRWWDEIIALRKCLEIDVIRFPREQADAKCFRQVCTAS
jgi:hypothetical protein